MKIIPYEPQYFLEEQLLPEGFTYPSEYINLQRMYPTGLGFETWQIFSKSTLITWVKGLRSRYPTRVLIPFAKRRGSDDIVCFEVKRGSDAVTVAWVHDFASPGWEDRGHFESLEDWLSVVREEEQDWLESEKHFAAQQAIKAGGSTPGRSST